MKASRTSLRGTLPALALVVSLWVPACDEEPPTYGLRSPLLRLVPDVGKVSVQGGNVFVLTELAMGEPALDGQSSVLTVFRTSGATAVPLPGSPTCPPPNRIGDGAGGADGNGSGRGAAGSAGEEVGAEPEPAPSDFATPFAAYLKEQTRNVYETGMVVEVPSGEADVLIVAAAYAVSGDGSRCPETIDNLLGVATLRLERELAGGEGGAGQEGPGEMSGGSGAGTGGPGEAGAPGAGAPSGGASAGGGGMEGGAAGITTGGAGAAGEGSSAAGAAGDGA